MDEHGFQMQHVVSVHIGFMRQAPNTAVQVRRAGLLGPGLPAAAEHACLRASHSIRCTQHAESFIHGGRQVLLCPPRQTPPPHVGPPQ